MNLEELHVLPTVTQGAATVAALLTVRLLPPVVTMMSSAHSTWKSRAVLGAGFYVLAAAATSLGQPLSWFWLVSGALYMLLVARLVHWLGRMHHQGEVGLWECAIIPVVGFVVVPAILVAPEARPVILVLGWDAALSSYSYCVEVRRLPARAHSIKECLYFLLVNPTLVYVRRGRRVSNEIAWHGPGARRMALGVAVLLVANILLLPLYGTLAAEQGRGFGYRVLTAIAIFVTQYAMHSGLASVQIGVLRQAGHELPERYNKPFLARSPADFWRRWNTYVGAWVQRYLYFPAAVRLGRLKLGRFKLGAAAQAVALMLSFVVMGLMHDAFVFANDRVLQPRATFILGIGGAMMLAWIVVERSGVSRWAASRPDDTSLHWVVSLAGRIAFAGTVILMIASG